MAMNYLILIATLTLLPMSAAAQAPDAGSLLRGSMGGLGLAGFAGMQEIPVPPAPSATLPPAMPVDETAQAVAALVDAAQKTGLEGTFAGDTLRKLGLKFDGATYPVKNIQAAGVDSIKLFTVTTIRGQNDILIEEVKKVDGKKQLRSYLISADGKLLGAAITRKENGAFVAESVPLAQAEADYRELLDFWLRYYRANLKKP